MDYWEHVQQHRHPALTDFRSAVSGRPLWMLSTRGERSLWQASFGAGDVLLFGPESRGLPASLLADDPAATVRIPMQPHARSLNLATAVAIVLYEALRQRETAESGGALR